MSAASRLTPARSSDYQLNTPGVIGSGVNSLVNVAGNLTLDGVLNVTDGGNFGSGSYRLLNYTGALTNNTLDLGTLPTGFSSTNVTVTTAVAGQVNLVVNAAGAPTQFWDGTNTVFDSTVHGGHRHLGQFYDELYQWYYGTQSGVAERGGHLFCGNRYGDFGR